MTPSLISGCELIVRRIYVPRAEGSTVMVPQLTSLLISGIASSSAPVWAYLDPGSGSMLFQVLIAGLLSTMFCAKSFLAQLRASLFRPHKRT